MEGSAARASEASVAVGSKDLDEELDGEVVISGGLSWVNIKFSNGNRNWADDMPPTST
jgi:hypothetical protein